MQEALKDAAVKVFDTAKQADHVVSQKIENVASQAYETVMGKAKKGEHPSAGRWGRILVGCGGDFSQEGVVKSMIGTPCRACTRPRGLPSKDTGYISSTCINI